MDSGSRLPLIDFTLLDNHRVSRDDPSYIIVWDSLKCRVYQALQDYGCFEALFNRIPPEVDKSMLGSLEQLFDLPLETKQKNVSDKLFGGYIGHEKLPFYESLGISDVLVPENAQSFTNLMWPDEGHPDNFCKNIETFCGKLSELDEMVRRMVVESLGLEKYWDEHERATSYLLRVMKYKGPETAEAAVGLSAHTDKNLLTILHQNQVGGLEIMTKSEEWIKFRPSGSNSFLALAAESLHVWTNGRVHAPYHRVMMSGNEARFSVGLFSVPRGGFIVKVPDELVDEQHPLLFKPFDWEEFGKSYYANQANNNFYYASQAEIKGKQYGLASYCGV